ncbi:MAG TPA: FecR domain-containing protein [Rhizomicrobium sp.]
MSEESISVGGVDEIETLASTWLERRECEDWSEKDCAELDHWLSASSAHAVAFLRIEDVWSRANRLRALGSSAPRDASSAASKSRRSLFLRVAITLVAFTAMASVTAAYLSAPRYQTYVTTVGGHERLSLSDGSVIELNTDTVLRVSDSNHQRKAWLDRGEAYFDIRHNETDPFAVFVAGHRVTDIGTKFVIRNDPNRLEVRLMEGRVRFEPLEDRNQHVEFLNPGDVAVTQSGTTTLVRRSYQDLASDLGWRRGMLIFRHTTLAAAAAEFNRYSRETIVVADTNAARATINGALPVGDLQEFTRMAQNFFDLRPVKRGDTIVFIH